MNWSIPLLRLRGIPIKVHATFALILVWAAYHWGISMDAGLQGVLYGIVAILLLFACVTLHELGHAVAAQHYGVEVRDITLLPIGGVAQLELPKNPRQELAIALAGPAVNVAIAAVLIAVGAVLRATSLAMPVELGETMRASEWSGLLAYLTLANIGLVVFNAIPAFPLDGGRVLRAVLALWLDYRRATQIAVSLGQGLALLFGFTGFATGDFFLIVIAIFVWFGASAEGQQVSGDDVFAGATVGQAMIRRPQILAATKPLSRAVELTLNTAQADFPVVDLGGRVIGLLTLDDLLRGLRDQPGVTVGNVMRRDFPVTRAEALVAAAQRQLNEARIRALPVVRPDGQLAGLLTAADISEAFRLLMAQPRVAVASVAPRPRAVEQGQF